MGSGRVIWEAVNIVAFVLATITAIGSGLAFIATTDVTWLGLSGLNVFATWLLWVTMP